MGKMKLDKADVVRLRADGMKLEEIAELAGCSAAIERMGDGERKRIGVPISGIRFKRL